MRLREAVRALIVDPADRVLLVRFWWEGVDPADGFWAVPGGGMEGDETRLAALQRELLEETGLTLDALGPEIWTKTAIFPMSRWDGQIDHVHLIRTAPFQPVPGLTAEQLADEGVHEIRWWTPDEIAAAEVTFSPRGLPGLIKDLIRTGTPATPIPLSGF
ncbi:NUDIX hydrolase [Microlunatus sp. GCM10028923]|uniref:NUDIX hydrolase n=1 Tax=Microlunatus sp. GCM10028923 TaxID=3273400 RepID=UPI00360C1728